MANTQPDLFAAMVLKVIRSFSSVRFGMYAAPVFKESEEVCGKQGTHGLPTVKHVSKKTCFASIYSFQCGIFTTSLPSEGEAIVPILRTWSWILTPQLPDDFGIFTEAVFEFQVEVTDDRTSILVSTFLENDFA